MISMVHFLPLQAGEDLYLFFLQPLARSSFSIKVQGIVWDKYKQQKILDNI